MDLLYQRYASPFSFIEGMMQASRFSEFVDGFIDTINKERQEEFKEKDNQKMWELYLHRVFDKSFEQFKEEAKVEQDNRNMSASDIETTISMSNDILANFNPNEERGE